jgi:hypothetical protein
MTEHAERMTKLRNLRSFKHMKELKIMEDSAGSELHSDAAGGASHNSPALKRTNTHNSQSPM